MKIRIALLFTLVSTTAVIAQISDEVKNLVIMIDATIEDNDSIGAGIVFRVTRDRIYIVTARHVVAKTKNDELIVASDIIIKFRQRPGEEFKAELLNPLQTGLDMAVLAANPEDVGLMENDFPFELLTVGNLEKSDKVINVGQGSGREWVGLQEDLNVISHQQGIVEVQFFGVSQGDSGGGLFNEDGKFLGMTIQDAQPALRAIDAENVIAVLKDNGYEISQGIDNPEVKNNITPQKLQINNAQATTIFNDDYSAVKAIDGDTSTYWSTKGEETSNATITFLLEEPTSLSQLKVFFPTNPIGLLMKTAVLNTPEGDSREISFRGLAGWESIDFEPFTTDTLTITPTSYFNLGRPEFVNIYELELYGN